MSYRYEKLYIMHYGVGHDKGGHSGRYPWGSGKNPYGGVDPTTKKSDLFKLNGRKFNDVASDLIVKKKYGNRTDVTEQQIAQSKARTQAFLKGLEATIGTAIIGSVGNVALGALQASSRIDDMVRNSKDFTQKYIDSQIGLLSLTSGRYPGNNMDPNSAEGDFNIKARNNAMQYNKQIADMTPYHMRGASGKSFQTTNKVVPNFAKGWSENPFDEAEFKANITTWDNADIKTFENSLRSDFDDFQKQWDETNRKIEEGKKRMQNNYN